LRERYDSHYFYSFRVYPPSECISIIWKHPNSQMCEFLDNLFRIPKETTTDNRLLREFVDLCFFGNA
jgi:hypothetical protein